jgi:hypothetical protein
MKAPVVEAKTGPVEVMPGIVTPQQALKLVDKKCTLEMVVRSAGLSKNQRMLFLNSEENYKSDTNFTVVVQGMGPDAEKLQGQYTGKTIRASGTVAMFGTRPQLVLADLQQVEVVADDASKK